MNDLDRILALPVVDLDREPLVDEYMGRLAEPDAEWTLKPAQAEALFWIEHIAAGLFPMGVGAGKTLVAYLAPLVLDVDPDDVLVLVPAELRTQYREEGEKYRAKGFRVQPMGLVQSYETLSRRDGLKELGIDPAFVICDEAHNLRSKDAKVTQNFEAWLQEHPDVPTLFMSATLTTASLFDYYHLSQWTFGKARSPLPTSYSRQAAWARILDSKGSGPHAKLGPQSGDWGQIKKLMDDPRFRPEGAEDMGAVELARAAFYRRFTSSPGVVQTLEPSCDQPIIFSFQEESFPEVDRVRDEVDRTWVLPNDYECEDQLRAAEKLKQIAQGFYYYWDWEGGAEGVDREWLYRRAEYAREVRRVLRNNRRGLFSVGDIEKEIAAGKFYDEELREAWMNWQTQAALRPEPPETAVEWISDYPMQRAIREAEAAIDAGHHPIIWYSHKAVVARLEELCDDRFEVARAGTGVVGDRAGLIASIASHGTGLNLQQFDWNLVLCPPANGGAWEQMVGRTHRQGQDRPVHVRVAVYTPELKKAWKSALLDAHYLKQTQGVPARILQSEEA